ncbi:MAG: VCBS repeat-containing protein, partial [Candidatus Eisenbacteria bacterium]|nr:VCBS repeat-containing protein [Candidatus Eisenbacteria bacterium]
MSELHRARALRAVLAVSLLCAAPIARAACSGLASAVPYAAGTSVRQVVRGDFDRDGIDDLATANGTGATLSVLLGNAAGGFAAPAAYASGSAAVGLATGDFDGDGVTDLAVAVSTGVSIWRGTGTGAFTGGGIVACGANLRGVVCGDFDRDGDDDVAATSSSTNAVIVLAGDGTGAFAIGATLAAGTSPTRLVAADFDDDGRLDLACSNNGSANVSVFRGDGAGGFAAGVTYAAPGSPWGLATLDANADGRTDLLVSNGASTTLTLLRGTGTGAFTAAATLTTALAPRDLAVADFDGDGTPDVAAACAAANQVSVLRGAGGSFVAYATYAAGSGAASVCTGDFDRDGVPDLACANTAANNVTRWLGTCPAASAPVVTMLAPNGGEAWWPGTEQTVRWTKSAGVAAVDVERSVDDGLTWVPLARGVTGDHVKVSAAGAASERMRLRVRDAAVASRSDASDAAFALCGLFRTPRRTALPFAAAQLERADVDGDGLDDVLAASATQAALLRGLGDGRFAPLAPFAVDAARRVRLADVNGDGLLDLVTLGAASLAWHAGDGTGAFGAAQSSALEGGVDFVCADFDADGFADVAALVDGSAGPSLVVRGTDDLPLARAWSAPLDGTPRQLVCGDLDGDGVTDLAIADGTELEIWRGGGAAGRGDATFALASSRALPGGAAALSLGDFDPDGRLDVAACALASGDLWTLGTPTFAAAAMELGTPVAAPTGSAVRSPVVAAFDGDGRADVALVAPASAEVRVLAGTAAGFGAPRVFAGGAGALVAGDFAADGATDLLVARPDSS